MVKKIENYKGFEIEYNEGYNEGFTINNSEIVRQKLSEIKKYIDGLKRKEFKRFKVLKIDYANRIEEVEVTSHDEGDYVWIVDLKGRREKIDVKFLLKLNDENLEKLEEMKKLEEKRSKFYDERNLVSESLERIKVEEFTNNKSV